MTKPSLPQDDLLPSDWTEEDKSLRRKLEETVSRYFYESCDGVTQALLTNCEWHFTVTASALMLMMNCDDRAVHVRVLNNVVAIANLLKPFSRSAKIRITPPDGGTPLEIRVDEISVYQDPL